MKPKEKYGFKEVKHNILNHILYYTPAITAKNSQ